MSDGGKGDKRRPIQVSDEEFADSWDRIFNKRKIKYDSDEELLDELTRISQETGQYDD